MSKLKYNNKNNKIIKNFSKIFFILTINIFLIFISFYPLPLFNLSQLNMRFDLMILYFWALYFPDILNCKILFLFGIFSDLILFDIIGLNTLLYLVFREIIVGQSNLLLNKSFSLIWSGFALFSFAIILAKWISMMILYKSFFYSNSIWISWLSSVIFYPVINMLSSKLTYKLNGPANA